MRFKVISLLLIATSLIVGFLVGAHYSKLQQDIQGLDNVSQVNIVELINTTSNELLVIRGLNFREKPEVFIINSSVVAMTWGGEVPRDVIILGEVFKRTLIVPQSYNISKSYSGLLGMWIAISTGNSIYVVSDFVKTTEPMVLRVIAHELMHVLQYQNFVLPMPKTLDESLALRALIEGDADVVADLYVEGKGFKNVSKVTDITLDDPFIDLQLMPYVFGSSFIWKLYDEGGWALVNKAYSNPPKSMKHVMFPEKYLMGEEVRHTVSNVSCNVVYEDVLGPSYIYVMISKYFNKSYAFRLSGSWISDRITYCNTSGELMLYWRIKWNSTEAAVRFYESYSVIAGMNSAYRVGDVFLVDGFAVRITRNLDEVLVESFERR